MRDAPGGGDDVGVAALVLAEEVARAAGGLEGGHEVGRSLRSSGVARRFRCCEA